MWRSEASTRYMWPSIWSRGWRTGSSFLLWNMTMIPWLSSCSNYKYVYIYTWQTESMQNFSHFGKNHVFPNNDFFWLYPPKDYLFWYIAILGWSAYFLLTRLVYYGSLLVTSIHLGSNALMWAFGLNVAQQSQAPLGDHALRRCHPPFASCWCCFLATSSWYGSKPIKTRSISTLGCSIFDPYQ